MAKLPDTLGGCEALLSMTEDEIKTLTKLRMAIVDRIHKLKQGSSPLTPARAASVRGEKSPPKGAETK